MTYQESVWGQWLMKIAASRPKDNKHIESQRGQEILAVMLEEEKRAFNWRRSDLDTFWIDVQLFTLYGFEDNIVRFLCRQQPGIDNHNKHKAERNAYAEMMRGMDKLKKIQFPEIFDKHLPEDEEQRLFEEGMMRTVTERIEDVLHGSPIRWDKHDYGYRVSDGRKY